MTPTPVKHDLPWIRQALQHAIELEYSTLPIYLSAMFSLEVQNYTAYNAVRSVAMEEMVHMAIAANLLAALGTSPQIKNIQIAFPVQGLPGGAEPDLHVGLARFSPEQLKNFLRIEMPDFLLQQQDKPETYPTIAVFYRDIRRAIHDNADAVRAAVEAAAKAGSPPNQVGDDIGFNTVHCEAGIDPLPQFDAAIDEILDQGEGSSTASLLTCKDYESEESHYARFAELYYRATYEEPKPPIKLTPDTEAQFFKGRPIGWPVVVNTLAVPSDGYTKILALDPKGSEVAADLNAFDTGFSGILTALDACWNGPAAASWKTLGGAVHGMVDLRVLSCFNILRHQVPADIVAKLPVLYPSEIERLRTYTDLSKPVLYGPRFINTNK
ncbi:MAG TPA: ferritin-like protein [Bryobacteraceae bacterium]|jgi:hypothetical protein|nr:ferritin-like protein [Bryobacteraceae bacterium]